MTLGGGGIAIGDALIVGSARHRRDEQADGPDARLEAVRPRRRRDAKQLIAAGRVRPVIDRRYPLDEIVEALRDVDEGRPAGKVVIEIS